MVEERGVSETIGFRFQLDPFPACSHRGPVFHLEIKCAHPVLYRCLPGVFNFQPEEVIH